MWTTMSDIDRMFGAMDLLQARMNRMVTDYDKSYGDYGWRISDTQPRTNMYDSGDHFEIRAEVPGLSNDDLGIKIQGNYLEISGTRKSDAPKAYKAHRVERKAATFSRSLTLPADVDAEKVEAILKNGILTLNLPKVEAAKAKQIEIK